LHPGGLVQSYGVWVQQQQQHQQHQPTTATKMEKQSTRQTADRQISEKNKSVFRYRKVEIIIPCLQTGGLVHRCKRKRTKCILLCTYRAWHTLQTDTDRQTDRQVQAPGVGNCTMVFSCLSVTCIFHLP
jgi:hypothetical protein